ncbi:glutaredoxin family protein [Paraoerskovia marina]|uniref:Glutaredoxin-like domain n=1 Tax=Paraoerskovia marina TaxID=545619 RepID=A0A1H1VKG6_9CELL|nr:glutaredoxin family protein [Paraoerskovia marina]SDS85398.1 Glutaredoxin-like domain [Paraoerskovia marina]
MTENAARVVLYGRDGCHLCEVARDVVADVCARTDTRWVETDVDTDPALADEHGEFVPVVTVDGVRRAVYTVDPVRLEKALRRGQPGGTDDRRGVTQ